MKKLSLIFLTLVLVGVGFFGLVAEKTEKPQVLRIHIRANSNSQIDQDIKYEIKDKIVEFLSPKLEGVNSIDKAKTVINENINNIEDLADGVLKSKGFCYQSNAKIVQENFPTRTYENLTLKSGIYDALIINLGSGTGDNWWCVIYPPLCFVKNDKTEYRSKLKEIIERYIIKKETK